MPTGSVDSAARKPIASSPSRSTNYGLHRHGYVIGKTLGSGAYAKVKAGHSLKLNKPVAVKIIRKKSAPKEMLDKFLPREIDALKEMDHENVVKLIETIVTETEVFLALEYAEKGDLLDYINARRFLTEDTAQKLFADLVCGLTACHAKEIVHRDLKCENLLIDAQLRLKITDFGFARRQEHGVNLETYCGSYAYAAPEVVLGDPYDGKPADVWSAGVVLYAMVSGRLPFKDTDVKTLLSEIASKLSFRPSMSQECQSLIRGMLKFNAGDRLTLEEIKVHPWMNLRTATPAPTTATAAAPSVAKPIATPPPTPSPPTTPPPTATSHPTAASAIAEEKANDVEREGSKQAGKADI